MLNIKSLIFTCIFLAGCILLGQIQPLNAESLRIGILPVLDTLPLQVAVQEHLFAQEGLEVELPSFASALERDAAMQTGQLDGYFGDLLNTVLLIQNGIPIRIVTVAYVTRPGQRMFALLEAPGAGTSHPKATQQAKVGISNATIIDYLLDLLLDQAGIPRQHAERVDIKRIPIRLQMLLSHQLDYALLPEPLVSVGEQEGARVVASDESLSMPVTVLSLIQNKLRANTKTLDRFLRAYAQAVQRINRDPEAYRQLLTKTCNLPDSVKDSFRVPVYPPPQLPSPEIIQAVQVWMVQQALTPAVLPYQQLVPDSSSYPVSGQGSP